ncbi:uncharacterized protein ACR2FA_002604 [Aphomia sociella]
MKFLAVFVAVLAVATGARHKWTLNEISEALQNPTTNPSFMPALELGLNAFMNALFAGQQPEYIYIGTAALDLSTWSLNDLSSALENPNTDPALVPYLETALNGMMESLFAGSAQPAIASGGITIPANDISYWTLKELSDALQSAETSPVLVPYLVSGLNNLMEAAFSGKQAAAIVLAIPLDVLTADVASPLPAEVAIIEPVAVPEAPAAVSSSPLVQIILNVNQNDQQVVAPGIERPVPEVTIQPVPVVERPTPEITLEPVHIIDRPIPEVSVNPVDVISPPLPVPELNPIDVIAVVPDPAPVNPIDDVAVSPPEINPIDLLHPVVHPAIENVVDNGPLV